MNDLIERQAAIDKLDPLFESLAIDKIKALPSVQSERLTDDDFETIRIHLSAYKGQLCNQHRWEEAEEYQRIIDRFMRFASAQPEIVRCKDCIYHPIVPENWNGSNYSLEWPVIERSLFKCPCHCEDAYYSWVPDEDWFCGNGKKRRKQNEL